MLLLQKMFLWLATFRRDEEGQSMVEYALIIGLVAIALVTVLGLLTGGISGVFTKITTELGTL